MDIHFTNYLRDMLSEGHGKRLGLVCYHEARRHDRLQPFDDDCWIRLQEIICRGVSHARDDQTSQIKNLACGGSIRCCGG